MNTNLILVVDDEANTRLLLRSILKPEYGFQVEEAANGQAAMDLMNRGVIPDLCIVDLMMPLLDGRGLVERMRGNPALKQVKVVTLSTKNEYHTRQDLASMGTYGHIAKPVSTRRVLEVVDKVLHLNLPVSKTPEPTVVRHAGVERVAEQLDSLAGLIEERLRGAREAVRSGDRTRMRELLEDIPAAAEKLGMHEIARHVRRAVTGILADKDEDVEQHLSMIQAEQETLKGLAFKLRC